MTSAPPIRSRFPVWWVCCSLLRCWLATSPLAAPCASTLSLPFVTNKTQAPALRNNRLGRPTHPISNLAGSLKKGGVHAHFRANLHSRSRNTPVRCTLARSKHCALGRVFVCARSGYVDANGRRLSHYR